MGMQRVEQHRIDRHDPRFAAIDHAAFLSKNLYNAALYLTRQGYIKERKRIGYTELARLMRENPDYQALPRKVGQWTLRQVTQAWSSFFEADRAYRREPPRFTSRPRLPKYLDKQGRYLLTYTVQALSQPELLRGIIAPSGLPIAVQTGVHGIRQVRIVPKPTHYVIEVIYPKRPSAPSGSPCAKATAIEQEACPCLSTTLPVPPAPVLLSQLSPYIAALDLGVDVLAALTTNRPGITPVLVNGRPLKAVNQHYNKERARMQALLPEGRHTSHRIDHLTDARHRRIAGYLHQASRYVIDWCVEHGVGSIVIGYNVGWKQKVETGKRNNQQFVSIPHSTFIDQVRYKAEDVGIAVIVNEESYTSKCSFLDLEVIGKHERYVG